MRKLEFSSECRCPTLGLLSSFANRCASVSLAFRAEDRLRRNRHCADWSHVTESVSRKRKGRPATGRPFLQGRIVPTEARPSKLSIEILGFQKRGCQGI